MSRSLRRVVCIWLHDCPALVTMSPLSAFGDQWFVCTWCFCVDVHGIWIAVHLNHTESFLLDRFLTSGCFDFQILRTTRSTSCHHVLYRTRVLVYSEPHWTMDFCRELLSLDVARWFSRCSVHLASSLERWSHVLRCRTRFEHEASHDHDVRAALSFRFLRGPIVVSAYIEELWWLQNGKRTCKIRCVHKILRNASRSSLSVAHRVESLTGAVWQVCKM